MRPGLDDKILTSWNALAIAGLARARARARRAGWADLAFAAADALKRHAWRDGRLLATRKGERAHLNAYLDDYAFLLAALIELMQTRFRLDDYAWARELADVLLDAVRGSRGAAASSSRATTTSSCSTARKPGHDNATPSGNGVAARALIALGHLAGEPRYVEAAERAVRAVRAAACAGAAAGSRRCSRRSDALQSPPTTVLLVGDPATTAQWHAALGASTQAVGARVRRRRIGACRPSCAKGAVPDSGAVAWVCRGTTCLPPIATLAGVERELAASSP